MNSPDQLKQAAAQAALAYVVPGEVLGVGTGSTVNYFIDALAALRVDIPAAVASSEASAARLRAARIAVTDLMHVAEMAVYIDGADEIDGNLRMIKGGGGALTGEKIVASVARRFICIADSSKYVSQLGRFPLPVEVVPLALGIVLRRFHALGARAKLREGFQTDNGNFIVDVANLGFEDPLALEREINQWPGVVTNGIFAQRAADVLLLGTEAGVKTFTPGEQGRYSGA